MTERRVLIVGGGTMGRGIAGVCALSGLSTAVYEADPAARKRLPGRLESSWKRAVDRGKLAPQAVEEALNRLCLHDDLEDAAAGVELALEAVPESLELKREVLGQLDRLCPRSAILASNTSSLPIGELARATNRPDRVIGIHFFNPVAVMPLVEIVRAKETSRETEEKASRFVAALGKEAIRVADSPGFATSRLGLALGLEAMRMVEEGVASPSDIDKAMELGYGHRMGPLKTSDLVGLDVRLSIAQTLAERLSETRFRPPEILKRLVSEGRTGQKSGHGFYRWEGDTVKGGEQ
ncbi:MAG TPA: 3-hydroxyacyl-CoA dehydrogenase family protein [Thermoanaerobaculia bacterium]|nr:3-hydroxyacyl-CoA dehydrogenase family protein [Thermoanaerobaculia bacterium]